MKLQDSGHVVNVLASGLQGDLKAMVPKACNMTGICGEEAPSARHSLQNS